MKKSRRFTFLLLSIILIQSCGTENTSTYTLNVEVTPSESGTVEPNQGVFNEGEGITLTPQPKEGYLFDSWSEDVSGTENPLTFTMDSDKSIQSNFVKREYSLNLTIDGEGTVTETVVQQKTTDYEHGTVVELTPVPFEGWEFVSWSSDIESTTDIIQVTIDREINLSISFEKNLFKLSPNGVTITCDNSTPGEVGYIGDIKYTSVVRGLLIEKVNECSDLTRLCTSLVTSFNTLFHEKEVSQPIGNWDVSNVTDMWGMFIESNFINDNDLSNWDVTNVTDAEYMFYESKFKSGINVKVHGWNFNSLTTMEAMFNRSDFNYPVDNWDVSNVSNMKRAFTFSIFNQDINNWDVSNLTDMRTLFMYSSYNQNISGWCVEKIPSEPTNFSVDSPLTEANKPVLGTCPD